MGDVVDHHAVALACREAGQRTAVGTLNLHSRFAHGGHIDVQRQLPSAEDDRRRDQPAARIVRIRGHEPVQPLPGDVVEAAAPVGRVAALLQIEPAESAVRPGSGAVVLVQVVAVAEVELAGVGLPAVRVARHTARQVGAPVVPHPVDAVAAGAEVAVVEPVVAHRRLAFPEVLVGHREHEVGVGRVRIAVQPVRVDVGIGRVVLVGREHGADLLFRPGGQQVVHLDPADRAPRAQQLRRHHRRVAVDRVHEREHGLVVLLDHHAEVDDVAVQARFPPRHLLRVGSQHAHLPGGPVPGEAVGGGGDRDARPGPVDELEALGLGAVRVQEDVGELEVLVDDVVALGSVELDGAQLRLLPLQAVVRLGVAQAEAALGRQALARGAGGHDVAGQVAEGRRLARDAGGPRVSFRAVVPHLVGAIVVDDAVPPQREPVPRAVGAQHGALALHRRVDDQAHLLGRLDEPVVDEQLLVAADLMHGGTRTSGRPESLPRRR